MVQNLGIVVPASHTFAAGENLKVPYVAEGAITPGLMVMKGTADNQVLLATAGAKNILGVADINRNAVSRGLTPLTAFAAGEILEVIVSGFVSVLADTAGITAGRKVMTGAATSGRVEDYLDTATAGAWAQANQEAQKDELGMVIGRAFTTAAAGSRAVIHLAP
jgi:hypothetical protein